MKGLYYQHDIITDFDLDHFAQSSVSVRFMYYKITHFIFFLLLHTILLKVDLSLLHLFICSLFFISIWTHIYFIQVIVQYYFINFLAQSVPPLAIESSFIWLLCPTDIPPSLQGLGFGSFECCFSIFLLSGTASCSRIILPISCPSPRVSHFSKELCFILLENGI